MQVLYCLCRLEARLNGHGQVLALAQRHGAVPLHSSTEHRQRAEEGSVLHGARTSIVACSRSSSCAIRAFCRSDVLPLLALSNFCVCPSSLSTSAIRARSGITSSSSLREPGTGEDITDDAAWLLAAIPGAA